jgi:hypothetical protein
MFNASSLNPSVYTGPDRNIRVSIFRVNETEGSPVVDVDDTAREVVLLVHWRGGQHSELRVRKPATGEHTKRAPEEAEKIIREMATRWSDEDIAATLNRMALPTGQGLTWKRGARRCLPSDRWDSRVRIGR